MTAKNVSFNQLYIVLKINIPFLQPKLSQFKHKQLTNDTLGKLKSPLRQSIGWPEITRKTLIFNSSKIEVIDFAHLEDPTIYAVKFL